MSLPEIVIEGRAVADANEGRDRNGNRYMFVRVACSKRRKNEQDEWYTVNEIYLEVQWFNVPDGIVAPNKGDAVKVVGELYQELEEYDGQQRLRVRVNAWGMRVYRKRDKTWPGQNTQNNGQNWGNQPSQTGQQNQPAAQQPNMGQQQPAQDSPWSTGTQSELNPPF